MALRLWKDVVDPDRSSIRGPWASISRRHFNSSRLLRLLPLATPHLLPAWPDLRRQSNCQPDVLGRTVTTNRENEIDDDGIERDNPIIR
jgi:hypothetical protein